MSVGKFHTGADWFSLEIKKGWTAPPPQPAPKPTQFSRKAFRKTRNRAFTKTFKENRKVVAVEEVTKVFSERKKVVTQITEKIERRR